jgi:hypothetical protein
MKALLFWGRCLFGMAGEIARSQRLGPRKRVEQRARVDAAAQVPFRRREHRGFKLTVGTTKRLLMLTTALCACVWLGACTPFAGAVSDAWPTWAGGEPKDVPPRPGAPGYEEFIAHRQHQDAGPNAAPNTAAPGTAAAVAPAGTAPGTSGATAPGTTAAVPPPAGTYAPPPQAPLPPAYARPDDRSPTQGGLY